jgi:type IV fimbrial biogenesis protein FimT
MFRQSRYANTRIRGYPNTSGGFTLVELMVVMVILVIVMSVAAPSFVQLHREASIRSASRIVLATLNYARNIAASRAVQTRVYFDTEEKTFWIESLQTDEEGRAEFAPERTSLGQGNRLVRQIQLAVQTENDDDKGIYVTFYPDGHADACRVDLKDDYGRQKSIAVETMTGRVGMVEPKK